VDTKRLRTPQPACVTIASAEDAVEPLYPGRYEVTRVLRLSNGQAITRVLRCQNPAWAKRQLDKAGLVVGQPA
jgi:hypothetical protein